MAEGGKDRQTEKQKDRQREKEKERQSRGSAEKKFSKTSPVSSLLTRE